MKRLGFDLVLLGEPASGKDTQALLLRKNYRFHAVESGKYWRAHLKRNTPLGRLMRKTIGKGHPTPVRLMKKFLQDQLKSVPRDKDILFVGNPRLKPEAQLLNKLLRAKKRDYLVVYIKVPRAEVINRISRRLRIDGRSDDQKEYLKNRFAFYDHSVTKTIKYFQSIKKIKFVNGNQSITNVFKEIDKILNDY